MVCGAGARQRGAVSLEYAGAITIAALIVGTIALSVAGPENRVAREVSAAICRILTFGQGGCEPASSGPSDQGADRKPPEPCVVNTAGYNATAMAAAVVQVGGNQSFLVEELSDGTFRVTRGTGQEIGAETGVGFDVSATWDNNRYGGALGAGAAALLTFGEGEIYNVSSPDGVADVIRAHAAATVEDAVVGTGPLGRIVPDSWNPTRRALDLVSDLVGIPDLPKPDQTFTQGGVTANAQAYATALAANANGGVGLTGVLGLRTDADGSTTTYYSANLSADAGGGGGLWGGDGKGNLVYAEADAAGSVNSTIEVTRDKSGRITGVTTKMRGSGRAVAGENVGGDPGYATEFTMTLPVKTAEDQQVADDFYAGMLNPLVKIPSTVEYAKAVRDRGQVSQQDFTTDDSKYGLMLDAKWVAEVALGGDVTTLSSKTAGGRYYNGSEWVEWNGCGG